jgi:hypothetical protein
MARERRSRSRKKKDDVRFVVIRPKTSRRLKLPDRLFHPERTSSARNVWPKVEPKASPLESYLPTLSLPARIMSFLIAAICISASLAMIVLGVRNRLWLLVLPGPFGIWYGLAWVRVGHEGWLPGGRLRLNPWGRE